MTNFEYLKKHHNCTKHYWAVLRSCERTLHTMVTEDDPVQLWLAIKQTWRRRCAHALR